MDLCCYHGGFSLNAKLNGMATYCVGVDSSAAAIAICKANAALNKVKVMEQPQDHQRTFNEDDDNKDGAMVFVQDDVSRFLKSCQQRFDVIVLDPPKLAPTVAGLDRAARKYSALNRDALKLVSPHGGLLMTCTCSAAMTQKDGGQYFLKMVQEAAVSAGRSITLLHTSGAASCHTQSPISYPAGAYLAAALFYVSPTTTLQP
uniref:S-adenosylmethionine-dependent methyltransferase domain-containing protein n=1 Tax=Cyclophora tenuis TaxID=216820 RepID=A0A6U1QRL5_CYCTE